MFYDNDGAPCWITHECDLLTRDPLTLTSAEQRAFMALAEVYTNTVASDNVCIVCKRADWSAVYEYDFNFISNDMSFGVCDPCYDKTNLTPTKHAIYELDYKTRQRRNRGRMLRCTMFIGATISVKEHSAILFIIFTTRAIGFIDDIVRYIAGVALTIHLTAD